MSDEVLIRPRQDIKRELPSSILRLLNDKKYEKRMLGASEL